MYFIYMRQKFSFIVPAIILILLVNSPTILAVSSSNYQLRDYGFGDGFTGSSSSYQMEGIAGETSQGNATSSSYSAGFGLNFVQQANVPPAPTVSNPSSYYNKLKVVVNQGNNPSDATYAIAVSTDNFASDIKYIQNDNTLGATLGSEDWQDYASWGGASGFNLLSLSPGTTYTFKVAAEQGNFTQTGYGPTAQASTVNPTLSFDLDISSTDTESTAPYLLDIGVLNPGSVSTSTNKIWVDLSTNASNGGMIYVYSANSGLLSASTGITISAGTVDLSSATSGYGVRSNSVAEDSGGPMAVQSPYNGSSNNVGVVDNSKRLIYDSSGVPVSGGRVSFELKVKPEMTTPAGTDYTDTLTVIATGSY